MRAITRLVAVAALGLALAGCDKCGHWFWEAAEEAPLSCRSGTTPGAL